MTPPSTDGRRAGVADALTEATNASLWLDKGATWLDPGKTTSETADARASFLERAARFEVPEGYKACFERRAELLRTADAGIAGGVTRLFLARVEGRLAIGLGAASLLENGLTLLKTWGVPLLPGSSLKGLAASTAHKLAADPQWRRAVGQEAGGAAHEALFGTTEGAGCVVFHDAWWVPETDKLPLDRDVMTVHHQHYYEGTTAPLDSDEPVPVPFLTTRGSFLVALSGPAEWVLAARQLLQLGLAEEGLGAKTSAGYGRMALDLYESPQEKVKRQEEEEQGRRWTALERNVLGAFVGPSSAFDCLGTLIKAQTEGCPEDMLTRTGRALLAKDKDFWKGWRKKNEGQQARAAHLAFFDTFMKQRV